DYFAAVDRAVDAALSTNGGDYFGVRALPASRPVDPEPFFDPCAVQSAFQTAERAVDPHRLADALSDRLRAHSGITFLSRCAVDQVVRRQADGFELWGEDGCIDRAAAVVNASWSSLLALDKS